MYTFAVVGDKHFNSDQGLDAALGCASLNQGQERRNRMAEDKRRREALE